MTKNDPRRHAADWLQVKVHLSGIKPEIFSVDKANALILGNRALYRERGWDFLD